MKAPSNAIEAANDFGLTAQRLLQLDPEYRQLLMQGVTDLWAAETEVTSTHQEIISLKRRLHDANDAAFRAVHRRDRIRRDLSALLPELEAIQNVQREGK